MYKNTKKEALMRIFSIILHNIPFVSSLFLILLQQKLDKASLELKQNDSLPSEISFNINNKTTTIMKKIFTLIALAVMAIAPKSAFAQEGITQTTYWNFDQFQAGNEDVAFDTPVNYGGLYIVGHSAATAEKPVSASTVAKSLKDVKLGDQTYQINYGIKLPGGYNKTPTKASDITKDAIAFDAGCAGTLYVYAEGTDAARGIIVYFNGEEKQKITSTAKGEQFTASVNNDQAGTYYITAVKAAQIYAVKFVPTNETASTKKITLPEQGVMTFSDVHAWKVPTGLKAYIAGVQKTQKDETITLALTEVETIPACTGVILEGKGNESYDLTSTDCGTAMKEDGTKSLVDLNYALRPVISDYTLEKTELAYAGDATDKKAFHNYILGVKDGKVVFAPTEAGTLAAGKAYYKIRRDQDKLAKAIKEDPAAAKAIFFNFGGNGETTGINGIENEAKKNDGIMFNLAGQKVQKSYKGMVIMNGKKFINK